MMEPVIERMEKALQEYTNDPFVLAMFHEAAGMPQQALEQHRVILDQHVQKRQYSNALEYGLKYHLLTQKEEHKIARTWCESILEKRPWEALDLARKYGFGELTLRAAVQRSEMILASATHDPAPALEIAKKERFTDDDYCKRAAHYAFKRFIASRDFSKLPRLVTEFGALFNEEEVALAHFLASAKEKRQAS